MNDNQPKNTTTPPPLLGEFKGQPTITLRRTEDDKYPFTFGRAKAKLIVAHIDAVKAFAEGQ